MDDRWETEISEYGAINITGFRIVDIERRYVREFLDGWKRLDPITSIGAGKESITVCILILYNADFHLLANFRRSTLLCCLYITMQCEREFSL